MRFVQSRRRKQTRVVPGIKPKSMCPKRSWASPHPRNPNDSSANTKTSGTGRSLALRAESAQDEPRPEVIRDTTEDFRYNLTTVGRSLFRDRPTVLRIDSPR